MAEPKEKSRKSFSLDRIEEISDLILQVASGDFDAKGAITEKKDEFDAIVMGINMLGEELKASTVSRDYLQSIYRGVADMLIVIDNDKKIEKVNKTVSDLLGYNEYDLLEQKVELLFPKNKQTGFNKKLGSLDKYFSLKDFETEFITKKGKKIPISISSSILYSNENEARGYVNIAKDISNIKKAERDLRNRNEELNSFIYRAFHDIKGPLASSKGLANLAMDVEDNETLKVYIEKIRDCISRLDLTLSDLLSFSNMISSEHKSSLIDFNQIKDELLQTFKEDLDKIEMNFNFKLSKNCEFSNDRDLVWYILFHLVRNSIQFYNQEADKRYVDVDVKVKKHWVIIQVSDNGIGIEDDIKDRVFNMFFRGTLRSNGPGLGLYIVKNNIEKLEGEISFESNKKGSVFTARIPNLAN